MSIYRVVVSYFNNHLQFMAERGVLAMTPGQALDSTLQHLQIDQTKCHSFKAWTQKPEALTDFSEDALFQECVGSNYTLRDIWSKRYDG